MKFKKIFGGGTTKASSDGDADSDKSQPIDEIHSDVADEDKSSHNWGDWSTGESKSTTSSDDDSDEDLDGLAPLEEDKSQGLDSHSTHSAEGLRTKRSTLARPKHATMRPASVADFRQLNLNDNVASVGSSSLEREKKKKKKDKKKKKEKKDKSKDKAKKKKKEKDPEKEKDNNETQKEAENAEATKEKKKPKRNKSDGSILGSVASSADNSVGGSLRSIRTDDGIKPPSSKKKLGGKKKDGDAPPDPDGIKTKISEEEVEALKKAAKKKKMEKKKSRRSVNVEVDNDDTSSVKSTSKPSSRKSLVDNFDNDDASSVKSEKRSSRRSLVDRLDDDDSSVKSEGALKSPKSPGTPRKTKRGKKKNKSVAKIIGQVDLGGDESTTQPSSPKKDGAVPDQIDAEALLQQEQQEMLEAMMASPATSALSAGSAASSPKGRKKFLPVSAPDLDVVEVETQQQEVLRLQHQLSEALQKVVSVTEEHITEKSQFLALSAEVERLKMSLADVTKDRDNTKGELQEREAVVKNCMDRIEKLENAIERQLDEQDRLEMKLERSEDEIEKLLIEIQDLEAATASNGSDADMEKLRTDLTEAKKQLVDKQREIDDQKNKIENLGKEVADTATVNKLQVDELVEEKAALEGKLRGQKLESAAKITKLEEMLGDLQKQLHNFKNDTDAVDAASLREQLAAATIQLETAQNEVEVATRMLNKAREDKEDLIERNNVLNEQVKVLERNVRELTEKSKDLGEKVLQWTERTYQWKSRAETAEKKLETVGDSDADSAAGSMVDEAPQGLFLQSIMDKQDAAKKQGQANLWQRISRMSGNPGVVLGENGEELSPEEIRLREMEKRNSTLEETISELRSEIVKMQASHKDEAYSTQKLIRQLQGENEALTLKNQMLEQICANESSR